MQTFGINKHLIEETKPYTLENMYVYRVQPIFKQSGFYFYRVSGSKKNMEVSDIYFFNDHFSGWAALKINSTFTFDSGQPFMPKWRNGEITFLRDLAHKNIKCLIIMELKNGIFYSEEIKEKYKSKDLLTFDYENFYL